MTTHQPHDTRVNKRHVAIGVSIALAFATLIVSMLSTRATPHTDDPRSRVDLTPLDRTPVHTQGRLNSFGSFSRDLTSTILDGKGITDPDGQPIPHDRLYLDLMLRPAKYANENLVFVKNINMRRELASVLRGESITQTSTNLPLAPNHDIERFLDTGRIAPALLEHPRVRTLRDNWRRDLLRTSNPAQEIDRALALANPNTLADALRIIPPPNNDESSRWISIADLQREGPPPSALDPATQARLTNTWLAFANEWRSESPDPDTLQSHLDTLTTTAASIAPALMPSPQRMLAEAWYFDLAHLTWVWILYLLAAFFLLLALIHRFAAARGIGFGIYATALALHTLSIGWRWWVSGRWPNSNMYEAVTTAFWFGAVLALALELAARRSPLKGTFALTASISSMVAMMTAAYSSKLNLFFDLDPAIRNMMPVLHDLWLYIHTNVIIASYALIFAAGACSVLYLAHRAIGGAPAHAGPSGTQMLLNLARNKPNTTHHLAANQRRVPLAAALDGATMVLIEMAFVLLWAGIVMGAIWADHSWGRPWGWDPKETFALNTFVVYLVLIHARIITRDKGLWTAILSIAGAAVMIFNWLVINFVISGLHSYA